MAVDERRRLRLYEAVRQALGEQEAATLMEYLPPVGWADVATKHDLDSMRNEMRSEFAAVRAEFRGELRGEIGSLRAELHDELREQTTRLLTWMIPTVLTAIGISVAVARLS